MSDLLIRMEIPFLAYPDANSDSAMIFHKWLPLKEQEFLTLEDNGLRLKLWFDVKTTWWASQPNEDEITRWVNVLARKIYADVTVGNLDQVLLNFISKRNYSGKLKPEYEEHQKDYEFLGKRVQEFTLYRLNRLIAYIRAHKGQHWLQEYPLDRDYSVKFSSKARINDGEWFVWQPTNVHHFDIVLNKNYDRYLTESDWNSLKEFVCSSQKTELHWYLLAGAESLASINNKRAALTEAITALEVAVNLFAANPNVSLIFSEKLSSRMGIKGLKNQVDHMGLSGTINYLFPVLFSEDQVSSSILTTCQKALEVRGNVVHNGQREIESKKLITFINGIRQLCEILEKLKATSEKPT